jgi:hypothetical protein
MMPVQEAIDILVKAGWIYEGSTKIDGTRAYIMRKYRQESSARLEVDAAVQQGVIYFTTYGLRREALKETTKHETHFA